METSDLGKAIGALTSNTAFKQIANKEPDISALQGIRVSVAVTGFQTSEDRVGEENSVLDLKPRFVAVAETNLWNYQAQRFADAKLGEFVNEVYGGEVELATSDKHGGKYFVWAARDGRKAYALVRGSLILFGNDESAIEKSVAVLGGEGESMAKSAKIADMPVNALAGGFVSTDGVAQLANIAGISLAMGASEESEVKSFIARVLPEIVRNSVTEVTWTANKTETGIEDRYVFNTVPEVSTVFADMFVPGSAAPVSPIAFVPADVRSVSRYDVKDPQLSWRSLVLTAQKQTDAVSGKLIAAFSSSIFESFGIEDAEVFLSGAAAPMITMVPEGSDESDVLIARVRDFQKLKGGIAKEVNFAAAPEKNFSAEIWRSQENDIAVALLPEWVVLGDAATVVRCLQAGQAGQTVEAYKALTESNAAAATLARDSETASKIVEVLAAKKSEEVSAATTWFTETRFNRNGIERRTVSAFGLIGTIIRQLDAEN